VGRHCRAGQPIEDGDAMSVGRAAEMIEGQRLHPFEAERRADLVAGEFELVGGQRQSVPEPVKM
jgi:hypothetical protein